MNESITKATQTAWLVCRDLEEALEALRGKPRADGLTRLLGLEERMAVTFIAESLQAARELHSRLAMVAGE